MRYGKHGVVVAGMVSIAAGVALGRGPAPADPIAGAVDNAYTRFKDLREGSNADYIPALAKVDPNLFGIALITTDGHIYTAGDVKSQVSIQSISKVFTLARVVQDSGEAAVRDNIGFDATGQAFNSIVAIEQYKGKEMNPLVNAGAIAKARGLTLVERKAPDAGQFAALLTLSGTSNGRTTTVAGTVGAAGPRIVRLDDYWLDMAPADVMLISRHRDKPGTVGRIGLMLGEADVNISAMHLARTRPREDAFMILALDDDVPVEVAALRKRQVKNFCCLLMLANGVPMFVAGDEFMHTQRGRDNNYDQDNETTWLDWSLTEANADILRFFRIMIAFRKRHPVIVRSTAWGSDVSWHGTAGEPDLGAGSRSVAFHLRDGSPGEGGIFAIFNAHWQPLNYRLPASSHWKRVVDTTLPSPLDIVEEMAAPTLGSSSYDVGPRAVVVLVSSAPGASADG